MMKIRFRCNVFYGTSHYGSLMKIVETDVVPVPGADLRVDPFDLKGDDWNLAMNYSGNGDEGYIISFRQTLADREECEAFEIGLINQARWEKG